ncbi:hypothetical protein B0H14DRAFT_2658628 [Mycena olivaceomarginata]|nr:hypothetical protein B0H14DRAFT_2658628 [Mycena olivaceomarginata]
MVFCDLLRVQDGFLSTKLPLAPLNRQKRITAQLAHRSPSNEDKALERKAADLAEELGNPEFLALNSVFFRFPRLDLGLSEAASARQLGSHAATPLREGPKWETGAGSEEACKMLTVISFSGARLSFHEILTLFYAFCLLFILTALILVVLGLVVVLIRIFVLELATAIMVHVAKQSNGCGALQRGMIVGLGFSLESSGSSSESEEIKTFGLEEEDGTLEQEAEE